MHGTMIGFGFFFLFNRSMVDLWRSGSAGYRGRGGGMAFDDIILCDDRIDIQSKGPIGSSA